MDDQEKKWKSSFLSNKLHILWAGVSVLLLAACMIMSLVLSDGDADSDAADKSVAETETVASEAGDVQSVEVVEAGDIPSVESEASNGKALPFFLVNFEEEGAEIDVFREFLNGERAVVVEPEFHGYQLFSDAEFHGEEIVWQPRVGGEATLAELLEAYFAEEDSGADEILYALTDIGGDGRHELYVRAQGDRSWGYAQLVMAFYYIGDDLHLSFAEEEGGRSSLTVTARGYVQSSGSTGAENISGETGRMGADGSYEEWYHFEAGTGAGVHNLLEDWDAYQQIFLGENNSLEEDPPMEVWLYTIDGQQYYEYGFYEEATQAQRDKCQEYLALCAASQGITFTPQEELDAILRKRQEALGITDDMAGNGLEYPDPIEWRNGFSYVLRGTQEWQQAYYEVLCEARWQNGMAEEQDQLPSKGYYLYDIDKDGIPELLLTQGTCEADYCADIYTWRKGETICLGGIGMGHTALYTWEGENALLSYWAHMGGAFAAKISIDGDGFSWDEFFQEDIYAATQEDPDAWYTDPTELVPGCVCLAEYRIDLDLPLVSYGIVMGTADAAVKNPVVIPKEEVQEVLLDVIENNGMVYGVTGDGFGGDTGYVSFEEYCAPKSAGKYAKTPLQVDQYVWVDVNGDGQIEMVIDLREDESQKELNALYEEIRVILSLQGEVVYAYCLNYGNDYLVLEDGAFYVSYGNWSEFTIRYLFDRDECFDYYVTDEAERNKEKYGDIVQVIYEQNQEDISVFFEYYPDLWQRWIAFSAFDFTRDGQMEIICSYAYVQTSSSIYYNFVYDMQGNKLFEFVSEGLIDLNIYKAEDDLHYYIYNYLLIGASHTVKIYQEVRMTESWDVEIKYVEWDTRDGKLINENSQDGYYIYSDFSQEEKDLFMKKNYHEGMNKLFWNKEPCGTAEQVREYSEIYKSLPAADPVEKFAYILSLDDGVIWGVR